MSVCMSACACECKCVCVSECVCLWLSFTYVDGYLYTCGDSIFRLIVERWGAGVETQKYVRGDIGGWGRVPFNETYAPSLSTIYDGA